MDTKIDYIIELFFFISFGFFIGLHLENAFQNNNLYHKLLICYIIINFFILLLSSYDCSSRNYKLYDNIILEIFGIN
jgi:hypothetical protein